MEKNYHNLFYLLLAPLLWLLSACSGGGSDDNGGHYVSDDYLNVPSEVDIDGNATTQTFTVSAKGNWTISGVPDWFTLSTLSGGNGKTTITISTTVNPSSNQDRTATLVIRGSETSRNITVTQKAAKEELNVAPDSLHFENAGNQASFSVTCNANWTVSGIQSWFALDKTQGSAGTTTIRVTAQPNTSEQSRTASITVLGKNASRSIIIFQEGVITTLSITPERLAPNAVATTMDISVSGTAAWTATSDAEWLSISPSVGTGSGTITVAVTNNLTDKARTGHITVKSSRTSYICTVEQAAGTAPELSAPTFSNRGKYEVTANSSYRSDFSVSEYGFCYSTSNKQPIAADTKVSISGSEKAGEYAAMLSNLKSGTTYYVRAYAISSVGIGYSEVSTLTTLGGKPGSDDNPTPNYSKKRK